MTQPERPLGYHHLLLLGRRGWWWAPLGAAFLFLLFVCTQIFLFQAVALGLRATRSGPEVERLLSGSEQVTPTYLALVTATLAVLIPLTIVVVLAVHRLPAGLLASVAGRVRWRWLAICFGVAAVAFVVRLVVTVALVPVMGTMVDPGEQSVALNEFTSTTRDFLLVVVLLVPLQAAGEEYVFRGYLTQGIGSTLARWPRVSLVAAVLVPAVLFALAHGSQSAPVFIDRLSFGLVAGVLVLATGGLEAGIALHVLNNLIAFGLALLLGDMDEALRPGEASWWIVPITVVHSLFFAALTLWAARASGVARTRPAVLVGRESRV